LITINNSICPHRLPRGKCGCKADRVSSAGNGAWKGICGTLNSIYPYRLPRGKYGCKADRVSSADSGAWKGICGTLNRRH